MSDNNFWAWILPDPNKTEKASEPEPKMENEPAKGDEPHMLLGKELGEYGLKLRAKDADGLGAQKHGSPWIAPIDKLDAIFTALRKKGYLSSVPTAKQLNPKKGASFRKPQSTVMVEMGVSGSNVYLYITDDNEKKK